MIAFKGYNCVRSIVIKELFRFANISFADCFTEFYFHTHGRTQEQFGDLVWKQALRATGCKHTVFNTHQIYPDTLMPDLAEALSAITYVFIKLFDDNERI